MTWSYPLADALSVAMGACVAVGDGLPDVGDGDGLPDVGDGDGLPDVGDGDGLPDVGDGNELADAGDGGMTAPLLGVLPGVVPDVPFP